MAKRKRVKFKYEDRDVKHGSKVDHVKGIKTDLYEDVAQILEAKGKGRIIKTVKK